jgi:hypothetical protein
MAVKKIFVLKGFVNLYLEAEPVLQQNQPAKPGLNLSVCLWCLGLRLARISPSMI